MAKPKVEQENGDTSFDPVAVSKPVEWLPVQNETEPEVLGTFIKLEFLGDMIEGIYERKREIESQFHDRGSNRRPKIQMVYDIRTADGLFTITGNQDLNGKMAKVSPGSITRVTYDHDDPPVKEGFNPTKIYNVEVARPQGDSSSPSSVKSPIKRNPNYARK